MLFLYQEPPEGDDSETSAEPLPALNQTKEGMSVGHLCRYCFIAFILCTQINIIVLLVNLKENYKLPDAASTSAAVAKKTEAMGGMPSVLLSQQPMKDTSRAGEEGEKRSPASSPRKPASGETLIQSTFINVAKVVILCF